MKLLGKINTLKSMEKKMLAFFFFPISFSLREIGGKF